MGMAGDGKNDRREFLLSAGRWALAAALVGGLGALVERGWGRDEASAAAGARCPGTGVCGSCPLLSDCPVRPATGRGD